ncbi:Crp/Fnr family transcriptional regulator [Paraburkholderia antibiotica]|uniref:Crp/Fnr family transcriptional regulator n=1 Tax=Paraburkholderia antibiotica TaxID=2728839 RepID=A0A7X9X8C7_9BURK|nr:Crp/Fnr family transcriptional regulator [Paraburkholderia antibiotica]NML32802.1 Crp/Fnr family transcriptional regulator [Paraburkholderia antibiotica]
MPESLIHHVATHVVERRLRDGEALFLKHDPDDFVALVVVGRMYTWLYGPDGRELIIDSAEPGEVVGETALVEPNRREAAAFACGPTRLLLLSRSHFPQLTNEPVFIQRLLMLLCDKVRKAAAFIESACLHRLESRLARYLVTAVDRYGRPEFGGVVVPLPPSQSNLAAMINASRPKLNAQLQTWRRNGLVSWTRDSLLIADVEQLRSVALIPAGR